MKTTQQLKRVAQTARQSICLTGLGSPLFEEGVKNIGRIHHLFQRHLPAVELQPWIPDKIDNHLVINSHTRYLTLK